MPNRSFFSLLECFFLRPLDYVCIVSTKYTGSVCHSGHIPKRVTIESAADRQRHAHRVLKYGVAEPEHHHNSTMSIILVTGANTGIGFELVRLLAEKGHKVYLGARNEAAGREAEYVVVSPPNTPCMG